MFLVVGLGNPGIEYQFTPHNAGFLAIDRIAAQHGAAIVNRRGRAQTARVLFQAGGLSHEVMLAKPETFMNLSGLSVAALVRELEIDPATELVVLYDELALPLGSIRVRPGGSSGGHNGAKSINSALGTETWPRVRIGVGPDADQQHGRRGTGYLLGPMRKMELGLLDEALDRAAEAVGVMVAEGVQATMNRFNSANGRERNSPAE